MHWFYIQKIQLPSVDPVVASVVSVVAVEPVVPSVVSVVAVDPVVPSVVSVVAVEPENSAKEITYSFLFWCC